MTSCSSKHCYNLYLAGSGLEPTIQKITKCISDNWKNNEFSYSPRSYSEDCKESQLNIKLCSIFLYEDEVEDITRMVQKLIIKEDLGIEIVPRPSLTYNSVRFPVMWRCCISTWLRNIVCSYTRRIDDFIVIPHQIDAGTFGDPFDFAKLENLNEVFRDNIQQMDFDSLLFRDWFEFRNIRNLRLYWNYRDGELNQI